MLIIITIVFITIFIVTIIVEKKDFGVSGDAILLNRYVTSGKEFGLVFSTGQYCLLVGAWGTDFFFFYGGHTGQGAN